MWEMKHSRIIRKPHKFLLLQIKTHPLWTIFPFLIIIFMNPYITVTIFKDFFRFTYLLILLFLQKILLSLLKNLFNDLFFLFKKFWTITNSLIIYILLINLGYLFLLFELNHNRIMLIINLILNMTLWRYLIKIFNLFFYFLNFNSLNLLPWSDLRNS